MHIAENNHTPGMWWFCHHGKRVEYVHDPHERWAYIIAHKDAHEIPVRLEWFRPVRGELPPEVVTCAQACDQARQAYKSILTVHCEEIDRLFATECPGCPWDGTTLLFPAGKS